jgi:hypothetical protein
MMTIENNKHDFIIFMEQSSLFRLLIILESLQFKPNRGVFCLTQVKKISPKFGKLKNNLIYVEMIKVLQYVFNLMFLSGWSF